MRWILDDLEVSVAGQPAGCFELRFVGVFVPACRGWRDGDGVKLEPAEPADFEVLHIEVRAGSDGPWQPLPDVLKTDALMERLQDLGIGDAEIQAFSEAA